MGEQYQNLMAKKKMAQTVNYVIHRERSLFAIIISHLELNKEKILTNN